MVKDRVALLQDSPGTRSRALSSQSPPLQLRGFLLTAEMGDLKDGKVKLWCTKKMQVHFNCKWQPGKENEDREGRKIKRNMDRKKVLVDLS